MEDVKQLAAKLADERARAREAAWAAVQSLQVQLRAALGGEVLRGLVDLHPAGPRWLGARMKHRGKHGVDAFLRADGRPALCLDVRGELVLAWVERQGAGTVVRTTPAREEDVLAEDLEGYVEALRRVLTRHVAAGERTREGYAAATRLAEALGRALAEAPAAGAGG